ncbi:hypothetical protein BH23PAT2_BH23PAT2_01590 [soil metagenome]
MDNRELGRLVDKSAATGQPVLPEAVAATLSDKEILQAAIVRGLPIGSAVIELAMQGASESDAVEAPAPESDSDIKRAAYVDPEATMSLADQLEVMTGFWGVLGHEVPKLTDDQRQGLEAILKANPTSRVIPTLLTVSPAARVDIAEGAKQLPKNTLNSNTDVKALWTPSPQTWVYGQLLNDPEAVISSGHDKQTMGYKTAGGVVTTRSGYIESLKQAGQTVEGANDSVWTFPVTDVSVKSPRTYETALELHFATKPLESPEMLIYTQLVHQANGTPNPNRDIDFANEAVYNVKEGGKGSNESLEFISALYVASVRWRPAYRQVYSNYWYPSYGPDVRFGRRDAASGISKP